jgi:hypothetical protein
MQANGPRLESVAVQMCNCAIATNANDRINPRLAREVTFSSVKSLWEDRSMLQMEHGDQGELDVIPPLGSVRITLDVSPSELELAVATGGVSLCPAMMNAIVAAMVVDTAWQDARL